MSALSSIQSSAPTPTGSIVAVWKPSKLNVSLSPWWTVIVSGPRKRMDSPGTPASRAPTWMVVVPWAAEAIGPAARTLAASVTAPSAAADLLVATKSPFR
jgi:hypothetical protein